MLLYFVPAGQPLTGEARGMFAVYEAGAEIVARESPPLVIDFGSLRFNQAGCGFRIIPEQTVRCDAFVSVNHDKVVHVIITIRKSRDSTKSMTDPDSSAERSYACPRAVRSLRDDMCADSIGFRFPVDTRCISPSS